jgi:hypothetical protein
LPVRICVASQYSLRIIRQQGSRVSLLRNRDQRGYFGLYPKLLPSLPPSLVQHLRRPISYLRRALSWRRPRGRRVGWQKSRIVLVRTLPSLRRRQGIGRGRARGQERVVQHRVICTIRTVFPSRLCQFRIEGREGMRRTLAAEKAIPEKAYRSHTTVVPASNSAKIPCLPQDV